MMGKGTAMRRKAGAAAKASATQMTIRDIARHAAGRDLVCPTGITHQYYDAMCLLPRILAMDKRQRGRLRDEIRAQQYMEGHPELSRSEAVEIVRMEKEFEREWSARAGARKGVSA